MSTWELLQSGFGVLMDPYTFMMMAFAIVVGTLFGALPGVSATMAVALGLPFTYSMKPVPAIVFLVAVYCSCRHPTPPSAPPPTPKELRW